MFFFLQNQAFSGSERLVFGRVHRENCRTGHHSVSRMILLRRRQFAGCMFISGSVNFMSPCFVPVMSLFDVKKSTTICFVGSASTIATLDVGTKLRKKTWTQK